MQHLHLALCCTCASRPHGVAATNTNPEVGASLPLLNNYTSVMADEVDVVDIEGDECDADDG